MRFNTSKAIIQAIITRQPSKRETFAEKLQCEKYNALTLLEEHWNHSLSPEQPETEEVIREN